MLKKICFMFFLCVLTMNINYGEWKVVDTIKFKSGIGNSPRALCVLENKVFVANYYSNNVSIIDTANNNAVTNVIVGKWPIALCVLGNKVFVANYNSGSISILEDNKNNISEYLINSKREKISSYPNPFNPECYIPIENNLQNANIKIKVYNILGQVVREINTNNASNSIYWDGRDNFGKEVSSGMYFYETIINNQVQSYKKMLMLK